MQTARQRLALIELKRTEPSPAVAWLLTGIMVGAMILAVMI